MKSLFQFISIGRNLALLFCLFVLFNFLLNLVMPKEYVLDLMFAYSVEEAYTALGHLNVDQREFYRLGIWFFDMPYLVIYCLLFSGILIKFFKDRRFVILPVAILVLDLFENLTVLRMLAHYPTQSEFMALSASFFSTSKWILVGVLLVSLLVGLIYLLNSRKYEASNSAEARI